MKKIISMILIAMLALSLATVGSATTLTSAQVDAADQVYLMSSDASSDIAVSAVAEDGKIKVTYDSDVLETATDAQATIIIFNATTNTKPTAGNMIQIDQFTFDPSTNVYEYPYEAEGEQIIVVMMGGTDINTPGSATIEVGPSMVLGDVIDLYGGLVGDGKVTIEDAVSVLQYTVGSVPNATAEYIAAADFNQDGTISVLDVVMIAFSIL